MKKKTIVIDDDDNDDLKIDKDCKMFLAHIIDDNNLSPRFEVDNGESGTRKFDIFSGDGSKRSKLGNVNPMKNRVHQQVQRKTVEENIQRDNRAAERRKRRIAELEASRTVMLVRTQQDIQRDNEVRKVSESKAEALRDVPLVRTQEDSHQRVSETKAAETSRVIHVELGDVDETSRKKNKEESAGVVDKDYMSYLTWLVDSLKQWKTMPKENLQKDPSDLDPPITNVPEKDPLVKVKVERDLGSWSDDADIIAISDSPFLDGEGTPFVASKKVVDLDEGSSKEDESSSCWFRKELMDVLKKPYDEGELKQLHHEASIHRIMTRSRELRKGREADYKTDKLGLSYRERFIDFEKEYKLVDGVDKASSLKLLRGFFFYLKNVSHDSAFKPWDKNQW